MTILIVLAILVSGTLYAVAIYNNLIRGRNLVAEGESGIDVQLKRRTDLVPNLVETVKGYAGHEKDVLIGVTEMRSRQMNAGSIEEKAQAAGMLGNALGRLFAVAENYPDLQANSSFLGLQSSLREVEEQLQLARRYYNGAVRDFNIKVESFPSNLVASQFGFAKAAFFDLEDLADRAVPKVAF